jgi:uncharacterized protein (DUF1015 family)
VGRLETVLTQPYDKITPEMQREYFARSPFNLAHVVKGEVRPGDTPENNVYTRAAGLFRSWREQGVLVERKTPALYAYWEQVCSPAPRLRRADVPGKSGGESLVRKALIGLGKLEPYDAGVVFRHEETLSAPKADRLELLRATRAHFEQIFMLYSDPARRVDRLLEKETASEPMARVEDDYGVIHSLWEVGDAEKIRAIQEAMRDQKLVIADGHHRYETGLNFLRECRASRPHAAESDCAYLPMTFVNMDAEGIVILPTHRLVRGMSGLTREGFVAKASPYFERGQYRFFDAGTLRAAWQRLRADMAAAAAQGRTALGAFFAGADSFDLLALRPEVDRARLWPELLPAQRALDVIVLHRLALKQCLGMDEEAVRQERFLTYVREWEEGVETVQAGKAQTCFFLNAVTIEQVREIAMAGRLLPQKSTDFYPKLLSGLVIYPVRS